MQDFTRYINPWLGRLLEKLRLDLDFQRGQGCWLYAGQERYLDCVAAYGALPFGHNYPDMWAAVEEVKKKALPGFAQPSALGPATALARRLIELAPPGLEHVTFANSGAEAVEAAIKMCRAATGRPVILSARSRLAQFRQTPQPARLAAGYGLPRTARAVAGNCTPRSFS